jgi:transcriptional regulator with XRE-family HTH domain
MPQRDDPVFRGRLLRAARDLLGWTQARVAGEAGVSTAAVTALEVGRPGPRAGSVAAVTAALERAGVRFLAAAEGLGQGVRYERPEPASTGARAPELHLVPARADTGRVADTADRRGVAARREPVGRLGRAGA